MEFIRGTPVVVTSCGLPETQETGRKRETNRKNERETEREDANPEEVSHRPDVPLDLEKHSQEGDKRQLVETA